MRATSRPATDKHASRQLYACATLEGRRPVRRPLAPPRRAQPLSAGQRRRNVRHNALMNLGMISSGVMVVADAATIARALLRPHREPASRLAWIIAILALPIGGVDPLPAARRDPDQRASEERAAKRSTLRLPRPAGQLRVQQRRIRRRSLGAVRAGADRQSPRPDDPVTAPASPADSNAAIDEMVADVDAARETVHGCFYIWLADNNGLKLKDAFIRAAKRGVKVRLLADALGSRRLIRSDTGARCATAAARSASRCRSAIRCGR